MTDTMERATTVLDLLEAEDILRLSTCMHAECGNQVHWRANCPRCAADWVMCDEHHAIWHDAVKVAARFSSDVRVMDLPCCGEWCDASEVTWVRI